MDVVSQRTPQAHSFVCLASPSDYPCALQRDILLQGRLYLSQGWLCFYSNVFWSTKVIKKVEEERVHGLEALIHITAGYYRFCVLSVV